MIKSNPKEEVSLRVMRVLQEQPCISQRGLSEALGVSLGSVNYCVRALANKGLIKVENFRASDKKLNYMYTLTPSGLLEKAKLTKRFLKRKLREYEALKSEIDSLRAEARDTTTIG
ncbi:MAG: MarR family EPS-associated transcriptional regulator [Pseudomonadales bacterium]|nr:MarR family EPS-associated transcriptional regulator [Pseudomonadales bacterium]